MDESGISRGEPVAVVSAVIVHGDEQLIPLEEALEAVVQAYIPEADRAGFVFHAKDIFHGVKYFKDRDRWPLNKRISILEDLCEIPKRLSIPIVFQYVRKDWFPATISKGSLTSEEIDVGAHSVAFAACSMEVERKMRMFWSDEVAQLVAENNDRAKATIRWAHALMRTPSQLQQHNINIDCPPLERIRGSVQFADKNESRPLQVADLCAFFIRGFLNGHPQSGRFYNSLRRSMLVLPTHDLRFEDKWTTAWPYGPLVRL
jgi:hypothetical protein